MKYRKFVIIIKTLEMRDNSNLLIFAESKTSGCGVARIFLNKAILEQVTKLIKKQRKLNTTLIVKAVSNLLQMANNFFKIQLGSDTTQLPPNLIDDLAFILTENYRNLLIFLKNKETDIMLFTLLKNRLVANESEWYLDPSGEFLKAKKLSEIYKLNVIAFCEPEINFFNIASINPNSGFAKLFLQNDLIQFWINKNDLTTILADLKKAQIMQTLSLNYKATLANLSNAALLNIAQLIHKYLATIKQATQSFSNGLILQFTYDENEIFNFIKIVRW